ncbi:hypothetical protein GGR53DRAFT_284203 [Hypoxylon sp. FL1150]|nr:hypothetical protein GGR53DRAFT_284203 [Hypoxylon sp. FL1150]
MASNLEVFTDIYKGRVLVEKLQLSWPHDFARTPAEHVLCSVVGILRWMTIILEETMSTDMMHTSVAQNDLVLLSHADFSTQFHSKAGNIITTIIANYAHSLGTNVFEILESPLMAETIWYQKPCLFFDELVVEKFHEEYRQSQYPITLNTRDSLIRLEDPYQLREVVQGKLGLKYSDETGVHQLYLANPPEIMRVLLRNSSPVPQNGNMSVFDALQAFDMSYQELHHDVGNHRRFVDVKTSYRLICASKIPQRGEAAVADHLYHCDGRIFLPNQGLGTQAWSCREVGMFYMIYRKSNQARYQANIPATGRTGAPNFGSLSTGSWEPPKFTQPRREYSVQPFAPDGNISPNVRSVQRLAPDGNISPNVRSVQRLAPDGNISPNVRSVQRLAPDGNISPNVKSVQRLAPDGNISPNVRSVQRLAPEDGSLASFGLMPPPARENTSFASVAPMERPPPVQDSLTSMQSTQAPNSGFGLLSDIGMQSLALNNNLPLGDNTRRAISLPLFSDKHGGPTAHRDDNPFKNIQPLEPRSLLATAPVPGSDMPSGDKPLSARPIEDPFSEFRFKREESEEVHMEEVTEAAVENDSGEEGGRRRRRPRGRGRRKQEHGEPVPSTQPSQGGRQERREHNSTAQSSRGGGRSRSPQRGNHTQPYRGGGGRRWHGNNQPPQRREGNKNRRPWWWDRYVPRRDDVNRPGRDDVNQSRQDDANQPRQEDANQPRQDDANQPRQDDANQPRQEDANQPRQDDANQPRQDDAN